MSSLRAVGAMTSAAVGLSLLVAAPSVAAEREPTTVTVTGTVRTVVRDNVDTQSSTTTTVVIPDGGAPIEIAPEDAADLPDAGQFTGELVVAPEVADEVSGVEANTGETIEGDSTVGALVLAAAASSSAPAEVAAGSVADTSVAAATSTESRLYVVYYAPAGSNFDQQSPATATELARAYWTRESAGRMSVQVKGLKPRTLSKATLANACGLGSNNAFFNVMEQARVQAWPTIDFRPGRRNHLVVLVPDECGESGYIGLGTIGRNYKDGGYALSSLGAGGMGAQTLIHELGHNLGLPHASTSYAEYGNVYSVMGFGMDCSSLSAICAAPALDGANRLRLGWGSSASPVGLSRGIRTVNLSASVNTSGTRAIQVNSGLSGNTYVIEARTGTGVDAAAFYGRGLQAQIGGLVFDDGVTITRANGATTRLVPWGSTTAYGRSGSVRGTDNMVVRVLSYSSSGAQVRVAAFTPPIAQAWARGTAHTGFGTWPSTTSVTGFQWYLNGQQVSTGSTLALGTTAIGKKLQLKVTLTDSGFPMTFTSKTVTVTGTPLKATKPKIRGKAKVGKRLKVVRGSWTSGTRFTYQWFAGGTKIKGATKSSYTIAKKYKGKKIRVKVTGRKSTYGTRTVISSATAKVKK